MTAQMIVTAPRMAMITIEHISKLPRKACMLICVVCRERCMVPLSFDFKAWLHYFGGTGGFT